jgi:hypothetical protein
VRRPARGSPARGRKAGRSRAASADTAELLFLRAEVRSLGAEVTRLSAALADATAPPPPFDDDDLAALA